MPDETENQFRLVCSLNWPARNLTGTFQHTVGRSTEGFTRYGMPAFPISLLRDAEGFRDFCGPHLTALRTQIREPWEFRFKIECDNEILSDSLPGLLFSPIAGPFDPSELANAHTAIRQLADSQWTFYIQTAMMESMIAFKYTGMRLNALRGIYKWFWGAKDIVAPGFADADDRLREVHTILAHERLGEDDLEAAAEHSKVAFDLSPTDEIANGVREPFAPVVARWSDVAARKENAVRRRATIAREGTAEHSTLLTERYFREGLIAPITMETENQLRSGELEERRQVIRAKSPTNPYRRGLELTEKLEADMGPVVAGLAGTLTEWPLEELRKRVTSSVVLGLDRGSPWFPDTRLQELASMSADDIVRVPFAGEVMPYMMTIHARLDSDLPGILSHALSQVPDH